MARKKMKKNNLATGLRIFLGAVMLVFGLNKFLQFMPMPQLPEPAMAFMSALVASGYMMPILGALMVVIGAMLLFNKHVPLALLMLAPISVNIVLFHLFLDLAGGVAGYVVGLLNLYLLYVYKEKYHEICGC